MRQFNFIKNSKFIRQLVQYFGVGGIAAIAEWTIFYLLFVYDFNYIFSVIISFLIATGINYFLGKYVFGISNYSLKTEVFLIYFVSGIGLLLNLVFMWILYDKMEIYSLLSKIISTGIVFFWNFLSRKYWIFKI